MLGTIAVMAGSAALSYYSAKKAQKRQNAALSARQAMLAREKEYMKSQFELQTFSKAWSSTSAGNMKIAMAASLGAGNMAEQEYLGQFDKLLFRRDKALANVSFKHQLDKIEREGDAVARQKRSASRAGWGAALGSAISTGMSLYAMGAFGGSGSTATATKTAAKTTGGGGAWNPGNYSLFG